MKYVVRICLYGFFIVISGLGLFLSRVYANVASVVRNKSFPNRKEGTLAFMTLCPSQLLLLGLFAALVVQT